jgi:hypothetical protein
MSRGQVSGAIQVNFEFQRETSATAEKLRDIFLIRLGRHKSPEKDTLGYNVNKMHL